MKKDFDEYEASPKSIRAKLTELRKLLGESRNTFDLSIEAQKEACETYEKALGENNDLDAHRAKKNKEAAKELKLRIENIIERTENFIELLEQDIKGGI